MLTGEDRPTSFLSSGSGQCRSWSRPAESEFHRHGGAQRGNALPNDTRQGPAKTPKGWQGFEYLALPSLHLAKKVKISLGRHCRDSLLWCNRNVLESTRDKGLRRTNRTAVCVFKGCS